MIQMGHQSLSLVETEFPSTVGITASVVLISTLSDQPWWSYSHCYKRRWWSSWAGWCWRWWWRRESHTGIGMRCLLNSWGKLWGAQLNICHNCSTSTIYMWRIHCIPFLFVCTYIYLASCVHVSLCFSSDSWAPDNKAPDNRAPDNWDSDNWALDNWALLKILTYRGFRKFSQTVLKIYKSSYQTV